MTLTFSSKYNRNGQRTATVKSAGAYIARVQTNGNAPTAHRILNSDNPDATAAQVATACAELLSYIYNHGNAAQKARLAKAGRPQIKTLHLTTLEWLDKANANTYFSALVTYNQGTPEEETHALRPQYGYGTHSETEAAKLYAYHTGEPYRGGSFTPLHRLAIKTTTEKSETTREKQLDAFVADHTAAPTL